MKELIYASQTRWENDRRDIDFDNYAQDRTVCKIIASGGAGCVPDDKSDR